MSLIPIKEEKIDLEIDEKLKLIKNIKIEKDAESATLLKAENINNNNNHENNQTTSSSEDEADEQSTEVSQQAQDGTNDDKKSIEPFKSSNEILAELFKVFNAAPPEQLLNDESLLRKAEKRKKHKKEKKSKKRSKIKNENGVADVAENLNENQSEPETSINRKKKHKKKKSKHSENKHKDRDRSKEKKISDSSKKIKKERLSRESSIEETPEIQQSVKNEQQSHHKKVSKKRSSEEISNRKQNSFYNGYHEHDDRSAKSHNELSGIKIKIEPKENDRRTVTNDGNISEISLSDEETYLRERNNAAGYDNDKSNQHSVWKDHKTSSNVSHNSFYNGANDKEKHNSRERERDRNHRHKHRHDSRRTHTRSRSRSKSLGIDKKRLLEIARKNVISMLKMGCNNLSDKVKDEVLLKMRYGGRTVEDLTVFCKKLSRGEMLSELSSEEDSDVDKNGNKKAFHHPFQLKEREPIVMHIRNSNPIPPRKTQEQTKAITMQFPVSSGQQHRISETWVPVETKEALTPLPSLPAAQCSTNLFKATSGVQKNIFAKSLPTEQQQEPAFKPVAPAVAENEQSELSSPAVAIVPAIATNSPIGENQTNNMAYPPPNLITMLNVTPPALPPPQLDVGFVPDVPIPSSQNFLNPSVGVAEVPQASQQPVTTDDSVFPQTVGDLDVSNIISKRLSAMRRLQENPMDSEALKMMYSSQKEMSTWASSKHLPGQFTGSTGANILKVHELNSGPQVWARRDQMTSTRPVTGGVGMHLLQKMGWKPGEGLGREKTGSLQPLLLDIKLDKRGLVSRDDNSYQRLPVPGNRKRSAQGQIDIQNATDKHPVCLLNELTSKKKWTPPLYQLVNENGPSHQKQFQFSVSVNGQIYSPGFGSNTKKEAKCETARHCLKSLGLLPN